MGEREGDIVRGIININSIYVFMVGIKDVNKRSGPIVQRHEKNIK